MVMMILKQLYNLDTYRKNERKKLKDNNIYLYTGYQYHNSLYLSIIVYIRHDRQLDGILCALFCYLL